MVGYVELGESSICLGHSCLRHDASYNLRLEFCPLFLESGSEPCDVTPLGKVHPRQPGGDIDPSPILLEKWVTCHFFDPGGAHEVYDTTSPFWF